MILSVSDQAYAGLQKSPIAIPWNVDEDIRLQARYLRNFLQRRINGAVSVGISCLGCEEGVSWVAAKLACAFAENRERTLLVDWNQRHPSQLEAFDAQRNEISVSVIPGLRYFKTVMPELLIATPGQELKDSYPRPQDWSLIVDFDCMKHSADVGTNRLPIDGVVFVIESEKQRREAIANALERIRLSKIEVFGVVVNRKRQYIPEALYRLL